MFDRFIPTGVLVDNYWGGLGSTGGYLPEIGLHTNTRFQFADHFNVHEDYTALLQTDGHIPIGDPWNPSGASAIQRLADHINFCSSSTVDVICNLTTASFTTHSPAVLSSFLDIPFNVQFLDFDFRWLVQNGTDDTFSFQMCGTEVFNFAGALFVGSDFYNSGLIPIGQFAGQTCQTVFTLNSSLAGEQLELANLSFLAIDNTNVPEPSTWILFASGLAGLAVWKRRKLS